MILGFDFYLPPRERDPELLEPPELLEGEDPLFMLPELLLPELRDGPVDEPRLGELLLRFGRLFEGLEPEGLVLEFEGLFMLPERLLEREGCVLVPEGRDPELGLL